MSICGKSHRIRQTALFLQRKSYLLPVCIRRRQKTLYSCCGLEGIVLFGGSERKELELKMKQQGRLPPGQSLTLKWPVLQYGSVPRFDPSRWDFQAYGLVETPMRWTWSEFNALSK